VRNVRDNSDEPNQLSQLLYELSELKPQEFYSMMFPRQVDKKIHMYDGGCASVGTVGCID
jgi:hypothetical protein